MLLTLSSLVIYEKDWPCQTKITYLATVTVILLLIGTIGIVNNGNVLTVGRDKKKYLERKYNELWCL